MNTFQLYCFLAVANSLSFARAAEQMNVSQPSITNQIKTLEKELDVKLFRRSTRVVEITPEGHAFIPDAKSMVAIAEQAKLRFRSQDDRPVEVLSIGCSSYTQLELLTDTLKDLSAERPNLHPRLRVAPHEQLFRLLESGTMDVVLDIREGGEIGERLTFRELWRSSLVCVCRKDDPLAAQESVSIERFAREKLIFCDSITLDPAIAKLQRRLAEDRDPADIHYCDSLEAAAVLAGAGFGAAILPEYLVPPAAHIAKVEIKNAPRSSFGMFYKPYPGNAALKRFIQCATQYFSNPV